MKSLRMYAMIHTGLENTVRGAGEMAHSFKGSGCFPKGSHQFSSQQPQPVVPAAGDSTPSQASMLLPLVPPCNDRIVPRKQKAKSKYLGVDREVGRSWRGWGKGKTMINISYLRKIVIKFLRIMFVIYYYYCYLFPLHPAHCHLPVTPSHNPPL